MSAHHLRPVNDGIIVLDYGSQYTLLIARRLRELGVYAEVIDGQSSTAPTDFLFHGIILSGGPDTATDADARDLPEWVLASNKPILGICYGMQLLIHKFGGALRSGMGREYGKAQLKVDADISPRGGEIFYGLPTESTVWMSHGDDVVQLPPHFSQIAHTDSGICAAIAHEKLPIVGLQFHPEVQHTEQGAAMLASFVTKVCRAPLNWQPKNMLESTADYIDKTVGNGKVLMAVSGGVDSTVAAVLLSRVLGQDRVQTVFVDHGLLRKNERTWVEDNFRLMGINNLKVIDAEALFLSRLEGVCDPEMKRKIIGKSFIDVFQEYALSLEGITHLGQGTLYPDVIESAGHGSGAKVIKSHHNVGGLPDTLNLALVEPFRYLFKDEVRTLGKQLGISDSLIHRHPFPGPGLAIRLLDAVTKSDLDVLREADDIYIRALLDEDLYDQVWQAFAVLLPVKSVGVMGDNRTYEKTCALRAVLASDGMTAGVGDLPLHFLIKVADKIVRNVPGINRVVYDLTSKPPATIEWE